MLCRHAACAFLILVTQLCMHREKGNAVAMQSKYSKTMRENGEICTYVLYA